MDLSTGQLLYFDPLHEFHSDFNFPHSAARLSTWLPPQLMS
ncbi:MAG: hypothetical protein AAF633_15295 [Chloroflexota bacterium]